MAFFWTPNGRLDVATDPADLSAQVVLDVGQASGDDPVQESSTGSAGDA